MNEIFVPMKTEINADAVPGTPDNLEYRIVNSFYIKIKNYYNDATKSEEYLKASIAFF